MAVDRRKSEVPRHFDQVPSGLDVIGRDFTASLAVLSSGRAIQLLVGTQVVDVPPGSFPFVPYGAEQAFEEMAKLGLHDGSALGIMDGCRESPAVTARSLSGRRSGKAAMRCDFRQNQ